MNAFTSFLQADWAERAGWTLLHSVWQIALVAAVYAIAAFLLRNRSADSRYVLGCVAILAMLGLPMGTYVLLSQDAPLEIADASNTPAVIALPTESPALPSNLAQAPVVSPDPLLPIAPTDPVSAETVTTETEVVSAEPATTDLLSTLRRCLPWATAAWLTGVMLLSFRPLWGWFHVRRLQRHGLSPLSDTLRYAGQRVLRRLGVNRAVQFAQSALVEVPTVVGCLRPMILLPVSAITGLSAVEIELILAHELAHVRRHDWLVNLAQTVIEALLFYHPGMWWVSNQIRKERENCCDDMAVALGGSRSVYVQALARLEQQRSATPAVVLAATGGALLTRVRRLLGKPANECGYFNATACLAGPATLSVVAIVLGLAMATGGAESSENQFAPEDGPHETVETEIAVRQEESSGRTLTIIDTSGKPIAGARVQFDKHVLVESNGRKKGKYVIVGQAVSNAEGHVEIPSDAVIVQRTTRLWARVEAEGYVSRRWHHDLILSRNPSGEWFTGVTDGVFCRSIVLLKAGSIAGRVLGPDGKPLAGAPLSMTTDCDYEDHWRGSGDPPHRAGYSTANHLRAISDENGEFRFENVPPGDLFLYYPWDGPTTGEVGDGRWRHWTKPGETYPSAPTKGLTWTKFLRVEEGRQISDLVVDLSKSTCMVEGRVVDAKGTPVVGARVEATWKSGHTVPNGEPPVHTDANGRYRLTGLPPSETVVFATLRTNDQDAPRGIRTRRAEAPAQLFTGRSVTANLRFDAKIDTSALPQQQAINRMLQPLLSLRSTHPEMARFREDVKHDVQVVDGRVRVSLSYEHNYVAGTKTKPAGPKAVGKPWCRLAVLIRPDTGEATQLRFADAGRAIRWDGQVNIRGYRVAGPAMLITVAVESGSRELQAAVNRVIDTALTTMLRETDAENPLGLDDATLINMFRAGSVLRGVAFDCESYYRDHDRVPKDVPELATRYQEQSRDGIGNDPFAPGKKLRLLPDEDDPRLVRVWSVGPDGDWDGGRRIDSTKKPLDGDVGVEIRVGQTDWHWLADEGIRRHLEGKRLAHYLAAKGPKLPKPELKDDGLKWGPVVDGLQLAVELAPKKDAYLLGETIDVRFHVRNAADYTIQVGLAVPMRQDMTERSVFIHDQNGTRLKGKSTFMHGAVSSKQQTLKPGETASYNSSNLAFVAPGKRPGTGAVGHWVEAAPGVYTVQFKQHFPIGYGSEPREWQGVLETAPVTVRIAAQPKFAIHRVLAYRKPGERPAVTMTIYLRDSGNPERFDSMRPERYPLDDLVLDGSPIITESDIIAYDWRRHLIRLTPDAHNRFTKAVRPSVWGVPFVVQADGTPVYLGAFWTGASSYSADMPTISLDRFDEALPGSDPDHLPASAIRIENSRNLKQGALPDDPRQDKRVYLALGKAGKLLDLRSGEPPWGQPVEKVQSRLQPGAFRNGEQWLSFDLRNDSSNLSVQLAPGGVPPEILVDNVPYRWSGRIAGALPVCKPGQHVTGAEFKLDKNWTAIKTVSGPETLELKPGKHTVQAIVYAAAEDAEKTGRKVRVLSNPVKIEITAAENTDTPQPDTEGKTDSAKRAAAPSRTTVRGKVVDDATGKPVADFMTQGGKFDPADLAKVVWGYSETRSRTKDGKFSATVRWSEGWTARIVAPGYLPQPVLTQPAPGQDAIEVVIRLKRGDTIRGRVLDHTGGGVAKAGVYLAGGR